MTQPASLAHAYPLVASGLPRLTEYVHMSTEERSAFLATATEAEFATVFLEAGDAHRLLFESLFPELDKAIRDRWLSHGSNAFVDAVRAHARESFTTKQTVKRLQVETRATRTVADWKREIAEREAYAESSERGAILREQEAADMANRYKELFETLKKRLADGIMVPPGMEEQFGEAHKLATEILARLQKRTPANDEAQ